MKQYNQNLFAYIKQVSLIRYVDDCFVLVRSEKILDKTLKNAHNSFCSQ